MLESGVVAPETEDLLPGPPEDWKELLERTDTTPKDWGGIGKLKAMEADDLAEAWEGYKGG